MALEGRLYIARPYDDETVALITSSFSRYLGQEVVLLLQEDNSLIGGFRATIAGRMYDASVLTKTNRMLACLRPNN